MTAIELRDKAWEKSELVPSWVRGREISLDQHNTPSEVAEYCWQSFKKLIKGHKKNINDYTFIEPSAGTGSFYTFLPRDKRIGIDIEMFQEFKNEYIQSDFLTWEAPTNKKLIAVGNPPFGYRGWLALSFMNRAAQYCEYVGFILPMSFQSEGKGSPRHRVKGMELIHSEVLPDNLFLSNGKKTNVNTLWQVWQKSDKKMQAPNLNITDSIIDLFTVDLRKERLCGAEKMKTCTIFLQRTFYNDPPTLVNNFSKVKYGCGYGIVIKKDKKVITEILENTDWIKYSNLTTHNARHISMYHIKQALLDNYKLYPK